MAAHGHGFDGVERRGLMFVLFQWVRSRTAAIVGLVVPISFEICASDSSGWLRTR